MIMNFFPASIRTLAAAAALAGLASLGLLPVIESADAKPMTCQVKRQSCSNRCVVKDDGKGVNDALNCMHRTCERQFKNCMGDAAGGSDRTGAGTKGTRGGKTGPVVRDKRTPRRGTNAPAPVSRSTPMVQPRPVTTASTGTSTAGPSTVRDHRQPRAARESGTGRPFGAAPVTSTSRR